jgi:hypothetical protein
VRTLVVIDAANVVGSVPDGWWRDRLGAARRLRDALSGVPAAGLPGVAPPLEVVLVVEGAAATLAGEEGGPDGVTVVAASPDGSGDDAIVALAAQATGRPCVVVTADRGLAGRVGAYGAAVVGPRTVPYGR